MYAPDGNEPVVAVAAMLTATAPVPTVPAVQPETLDVNDVAGVAAGDADQAVGADVETANEADVVVTSAEPAAPPVAVLADDNTVWPAESPRLPAEMLLIVQELFTVAPN